MKTYISILFLVIFVAAFPQVLFAKTLPAGFSKDQIWFSKDPFFVGDNIVIDTLVFNSSSYRMSGTVTLRDGTTTLDKRSFILEGGGSSQVITFPWLVTAGTHNFSALIEKDQFLVGESAVASSTPVATETAKVKRFADYDRNGNGVGDSTEPPPPPLPAVRGSTSNAVLPTDPVKSVEEQISEQAPTPVASVAIPVIGTIEGVRLSQAGKAVKNLDSAENAIAAHLGTTTDTLKAERGGRASAGWSMLRDGITEGLVVRSPLDYIKLLLALVTHFFTANPYAFYILLLLVLYKATRFVISLFS